MQVHITPQCPEKTLGRQTFLVGTLLFCFLLCSGSGPVPSVRAKVPGEPYQVSGEMVLFGDVENHLISPDSSRVVYRADQDTDTVIELYSASITGANPVVKLNRKVDNDGGMVFNFEIT